MSSHDLNGHKARIISKNPGSLTRAFPQRCHLRTCLCGTLCTASPLAPCEPALFTLRFQVSRGCLWLLWELSHRPPNGVRTPSLLTCGWIDASLPLWNKIPWGGPCLLYSPLGPCHHACCHYQVCVGAQYLSDAWTKVLKGKDLLYAHHIPGAYIQCAIKLLYQLGINVTSSGLYK